MPTSPPIRYTGTRIEAMRQLNASPRPILAKFSVYWIRETQRAFREQGRGPFNWDERINPNVPAILRDVTARPSVKGGPGGRRFRGRPALVDTGALKNTVTTRFVRENLIEAGSPQPYANAHQLGGPRSIPITRPMKANLWAWMKSLSKAARKRMQALLGYLFGLDVFDISVRARPFVLFTPADRRQMLVFIGDAYRRWRGGQA